MGILKDFKDFAFKGNVIDLATAVIIGAAFGKIVSSLVTDIIMPPLGYILGGLDFKDMKLLIKEAVGKTPAVTWNYGMFIQNVIDFLIIAFCIFMLVKAVQKAQLSKVPPPPEPTAQEKLLTEIRDLLKNK